MAVIKTISLDSETEKILREISKKTGKPQSVIVREGIREIAKKIE
jgi:predicted DNA-binding protein